MMRQSNTESVARALSDPLRLDILSRLLSGPATVTDVVSSSGASQPNVSNHLAVLRQEGLVRGDRAGRQVRYRLANPTVGQFVEALVAIAGPKDGRPAPASPLAEARSCYDHLAGRLGVSVLDALIDREALTPPGPDGVVHLGDEAAEVFDDLGVDVSAAAASRRRLAFACVDWTERRAHLGGALGAALLARLLDQEWLRRQRDSRALLTTPAGREGLQRTLGCGSV
jgi:DNA-binding transcriptional ArsR family regulator